MYELCRILEHVVDGLDDAPPSQHDLVPHGHESVLHVRPDARDQMYSILKEHVEEPWRNVSPVGKELSVEVLCQYSPYFGIPVIDVGPREAECDDLAPVVADQMQLEAVTPSHRPLPVCGHPLEDFVGIAAQIVTDRHHRGVHEADARAAPEGREVQEEHHLEEHAALEFHEAVVGYGMGGRTFSCAA